MAYAIFSWLVVKRFGLFSRGPPAPGHAWHLAFRVHVDACACVHACMCSPLILIMLYAWAACPRICPDINPPLGGSYAQHASRPWVSYGGA
eukprot:363138-Chlamydomonas_euryale.AAC.5